jgi:hypothetical protein
VYVVECELARFSLKPIEPSIGESALWGTIAEVGTNLKISQGDGQDIAETFASLNCLGLFWMTRAL